MKKRKLISILLMVAALVHTADACTVIVAGRKATVDGSVLNSHTHCGPDCRIQIVLGQTYPEGAMAPVYYGLLTANQKGQEEPEILGYIPQARQTYTYFHSAYSFSVVPARKLSLQDIMAFQRSTCEGTIYDKENDAAWYYPDAASGKVVKSKLATPFPTSEMQKLMKTTRRRAVARMDGEYGMVAQLRNWLPREIGGVYWVFVDNAYTSPYMPFFTGTTVVPEVYRTYHPDVYSDSSARWGGDFVDNLLYLNWQEGKQELQAVRKPLEASFFTRNGEIERDYLSLAAKNPRKATALLNTYEETCAAEIMQTYHTLRNTLLVKYTNNRR